jgi:hypothetical protein
MVIYVIAVIIIIIIIIIIVIFGYLTHALLHVCTSYFCQNVRIVN